MKIYRLAAKIPIIWRIETKVMGGNYRDMGAEIEAATIGEARNKFYRDYPDKAHLYNPENVVPVPDWNKTKEYQERRRQDRRKTREWNKLQKKLRQRKIDDYLASRDEQFP